MGEPAVEPLRGYGRPAADELVDRARVFGERMATCRTVRDFAPDPVPRAVIEEAVLTAGSAPSGANLQPWHFAAIGPGPLRRRIREAAEAEERAFYGGRAGEEWLAVLAPSAPIGESPFSRPRLG